MPSVCRSNDHQTFKIWKIFEAVQNSPTVPVPGKIDGTELEGPKETMNSAQTVVVSSSNDGKFGRFIVCTNYPKCKYVKQSENNQNKTGVKCPECKKWRNDRTPRTVRPFL